MARIAGIDLPKDKRIEIGLTYIYGIGRKSAKDILAQTGVNPDTRVKDLSDADEQKLRDAIDAYVVEGDLRRQTALDIKRLTEIGCATAAACPSAGSAARPTPAPAKVPRRPLPTRRSKEGEPKWQLLNLAARRLFAAAVKERTSNAARSISVLLSTTPW
jgi:small subunit ribosomal protein S13